MVTLPLLAAKRRNRWLVGIGIVALAALGAFAIWRLSSPRLNVILITLDTTRADRLGIYGDQNAQTTGFDVFAKDGVVFERAYAPAPITLPSHATLLTGLYPPEHGLRVNGSGQLGKEIPVLTEILKDRGYETGAFIAAVVLDSKYGLDRGFDTYDDEIQRSARHAGEPRRDGQQVVDSALKWLQHRTAKPFFCWIHLYDAHAPYDPRPELFGQDFAKSPYDAGIAYEARQFHRVMEFLHTQKLDTNTLVVIVGDHGEGLNEHLETEHGMLVYNTTLHVPLAFLGPRPCQRGTRVPEAVSLVDVMPTVLDLMKLSAPRHVSGRSLLPALKGQPIEPRDCYAETETPFLLNRWSPLQTVISDHWKYIHTTQPELYDLSIDPGELTNLIDSASHHDERRQMQDRLSVMQESFVPIDAQHVNLSEKDLAALQALGYVSGGKTRRDDGGPKNHELLPDVKDFLPYLSSFEEAKHIGLEGRVQEAITLLEEVVRQTQQFPAADLLLGDCLAQAGRLEDAAKTYQAVLVKRPDFDRAHFSLGKVLTALGRTDEATDQFREHIKANPTAAMTHLELAQLLIRSQKLDEAEREFRTAQQLAPDLVPAHLLLGQLLVMRKRPTEAVACFLQAAKLAPRSAVPHLNLMQVLAQLGQAKVAIEHGKKAVTLEPASFEGHFNLGLLLVSQQRIAEGVAELRQAHHLQPNNPRPLQQIQRIESATKQPIK
ncbi:sulfatase-like hydrolase/transferase [Schlesneria paludicola]|uniref:sulfatase-like hydrolase/transferase n=1 Tax=Schlesneria paludicola TaxID=360056 RepID=UPI000299FEE1|nr:sulfatase-like hydrolase/transferase [Schlesneria paludicola]